MKGKSVKPILLTVTVFFVICSAFFGYTYVSSGAAREFAQADDFPRGALVYAQFQDLPAVVKLWDDSPFKQRYLESQNFNDFQNRHLALKLVSRWQEFNAALGFELDAAKIITATENRAAVAVYDIGKLELVFIAPLADEKFAATMFFQNQTQFEEITLPDGSLYYSHEVKADRGRQKQKIVFANVKGRFVLATSEDLLLRTLSNLSGKTSKERLSDDPNFSALAAKTEPHLATVWVNQAKLNEDWYFKNYWILQNAEELKNIRAGMFDFEMPGGKFIERREFLLNEKALANSKIPASEADHLQTMIPSNTSFFKMQSVTGKPALAANLIFETLLDKSSAQRKVKRGRRWNSYDSFSYQDASDYHDYSYLGSDFNESIDEEETESETISTMNPAQTNRSAKLEQILAAAGASSAVSITDPQVLENPLFVEFRRATIFNLRSPENFNQTDFEKVILETAQNRLGVEGQNLNFTWETKTENETAWRELNLPALGWRLSYVWQKNNLIVAGNLELLKSVLRGENSSPKQPSTAFDELLVIKLSQRANAFDGVMEKLAPEKTKDKVNNQDSSDTKRNDFFMNNIGSLLDTAKDVDRIEIRKNRGPNSSSEEISFVLK
ncbi:MAG: hypothetical protein ABI954_08995 [Pyrinomonadaceae bacterium]